MIAEQVYKLKLEDYTNDGMNQKTGIFFLETLEAWERDFHTRFPLWYANHIYANNAFMILLKGCLELSPVEDCGMELINGIADLDANLEMEKHSQRSTIYALGSMLEKNKEDPVFLVSDDSLLDGIVLLKYIPDNDADEDETEVPVHPEKSKVVT